VTSSLQQREVDERVCLSKKGRLKECREKVGRGCVCVGVCVRVRVCFCRRKEVQREISTEDHDLV
jgi:hypothetical protein